MDPAGRVPRCPLRHFLLISRVVSWCAGFPEVRVCGCCVVASTLVGTPSSAPPNSRLVLPLDALGRVDRVGSVPVVPVALGRYGTF